MYPGIFSAFKQQKETKLHTMQSWFKQKGLVNKSPEKKNSSVYCNNLRATMNLHGHRASMGLSSAFCSLWKFHTPRTSPFFIDRKRCIRAYN